MEYRFLISSAIVFLKSAVDLFRSAATQLDQIIKSSDLANEM
jgi:hypothetical protein